MKNIIEAGWKVHTARLLEEVLSNDGMGILKQLFNIFATLLAEVAQRAAELNDPELNALMCRLTLYEIADPYSADHDPERVDKIMQEAKAARAKNETVPHSEVHGS